MVSNINMPADYVAMATLMDRDTHFTESEPHGWIQWKGTDACIDLRCPCGHLGHFDGEFFYYFECPNCHAKYQVGQNIALIKMTDEEVKIIDPDFKTCDLDMEEINAENRDRHSKDDGPQRHQPEG